MAKPRIFISSTYYDLKQTREDVADFVLSLGYEPVRNEEGNIPYGRDTALEDFCYKEVQNVDILISIIGGRFGTESQKSRWSISNEELKQAIKLNRQVYICIEKNVYSEYETYSLNKENSNIKYRFVDIIKIYQFIDELRGLTSNNNIMAFETSADIKKYLKEQFAGLFQSALNEQSRTKEIELVSKLENTSKVLERLVDYLKESSEGKEDGISKFLKMSHPLVNHLEEELNINFNFWIDDFDELKNLLATLGWDFSENNDNSTEDYLWTQAGSSPFENSKELRLSKELFDKDGKLKDVKASEWKKSFLIIEEKDEDSSTSQPSTTTEYNSDDLPF